MNSQRLLASALLDLVLVILCTKFWIAMSDSISVHEVIVYALFLIINYVNGTYTSFSYMRGLLRLITSTVFSLIVLAAITYTLLSGSDTSRIVFMSLWSVSLCALVLTHRVLAFNYLLNLDNREFVLIGTNELMSKRLTDLLPNCKILTSDEARPWLESTLAHKKGDEDITFVLGQSVFEEQKFGKTVLKLSLMGRNIYRDDKLYSELTGRQVLGSYSTQTDGDKIYDYLLERSVINESTPFVESMRGFTNKLFAFLMLVVLAVPMVIICIAILLESKGGALYTQKRLGKGKKPFTIYKFRSMVSDAESNGPQWARVNDGRATTLGKFLRLSHLDELPQLFNVLKGDMNLVGPRPIREHFSNILEKDIEHFELRYLIKPGLTGWAQTLAPRGVDMNEEKTKFEFDLFYILNRSKISDLMIIAMTISKLLTSFSVVNTGSDTPESENVQIK